MWDLLAQLCLHELFSMYIEKAVLMSIYLVYIQAYSRPISISPFNNLQGDVHHGFLHTTVLPCKQFSFLPSQTILSFSWS